MELRESETFRNLMKAYEGELKASGNTVFTQNGPELRAI